MALRREPVSRRDRPAKPALSRAGVIAVALRVMREEGLERVTMRRLAEELDTGPASLYVYVRNMAELHGAVLDELLAEVEPAGEAAADWRERLIGLLTDCTMLLMRYPSLARSVLTLRPSGPHYLRLIDSVLVLLRQGGVGVRQAAWGVDILLQHAIATAAEQGTREEAAEAGAEQEVLERLLNGASPQDHPGIAWAVGELVSGTGPQRVRWAFATLIDGIAAG
jgi:AcrR family transcriptional regulator